MSLKQGCYLVSFKPSHTDWSPDRQTYVGTLRVVEVKSGRNSELRVSGDLYRLNKRARAVVAVEGGWKATAATGREKIPVFRLSDYSHYLNVLAVEDGADGVTVLGLQAHKFDPDSRRLTPGAPCEVVLRPDSTTRELLTGALVSEGQERGQFSLRWISKSLRRAQLRICRIQPNANGPIRRPKGDSQPRLQTKTTSGTPKGTHNNATTPRNICRDWVDLFEAIGWKLAVSSEDRVIDEFKTLTDRPWSPYDLSTAALKLREGIDPDGGWVYDLICVSRLENERHLGIMFDTEATDLNQRPRESAAVAALQKINVNGALIDSQDAFDGRLYYRTALHEVGHAMNLPHNLRGKTLMNTTEFLLSPRMLKEGQAAGFNSKFDPEWGFDPKDVDWLQHAPDIAIRPGGISRHGVRWRRGNQQQVTTISVYDPSLLSLVIEPVDSLFPLGAPVRLNYTFSNHGPAMRVPRDISLRGGHISGRVIGPDRITRYFRSAFRCCDSVAHDQPLLELRDTPMRDGMTLLRGIDGPLFPRPGSYELELELRWDANGQTNRVVGHAHVLVDKADPETDPNQVMAAEFALNRSSMMPALIQGLLNEEGARALSNALNSPTLAPHYLATALKCKIMGTERGQNWEELVAAATKLNRGGRTSPVVPDRPPQPTGQIINPDGGSPVRPSIVHTVREQKHFGLRSDKNQMVDPDQMNPTLASDLIGWLLKIKSITRQPAPASPQPRSGRRSSKRLIGSVLPSSPSAPAAPDLSSNSASRTSKKAIIP